MIKAILKKRNWPKLPKADSSYIRKFSIARLHFEQNRIEDQLVFVKALVADEADKDLK